MPDAKFRRALASNRAKLCTICPYPRHRTSRYCRRHAIASTFYGHPLGRAIRTKELAPYRKLAAEFIETHQGHPAITEATGFLDSLLKVGTARPGRSAGHRELDRLAQQGMNGREAAEIVLGVWLLAHLDARALPDDDRLTFAIAHALMRSRPRTPRKESVDRNGKLHRDYAMPGSRAHREIGGMVRSKLALFLANVTKAMDAQEERKRAQVNTLATPFDPQESAL